MQEPTIDPNQLSHFCTRVLVTEGVTQSDATLVADTLVQADLWGHQSHGVLRLPWYVARLRSGAMTCETQPEVVTDTGALLLLDGADGIGQVIAKRATMLAIERANAHGIGAVAVRNGNHFGTAMYYTKMAAELGCVALLSTNASPAMAPWGGREKRIGTNPWSIGAPVSSLGEGRAPMVLDMANTAVARGKIYLAKQQGIPIPEGWTLDEDGSPTTDPLRAIAGMVLPMAGHKGYGMALMMDVLSGVLTGSQFGINVHGPYEADARSGCGHLMIAIKIDALMPLAEFYGRIQELVSTIKSTPLAAGISEIFYPGEIEALNEKENRASGITLPNDTIADLEKLGQECQVSL